MTTTTRLDTDGKMLRTSAPDVAQVLLGTRFARHELRVLGQGRKIDFSLHQERMYDLKFHEVSYGRQVEVATSGWTDFYLLQLTLAGRCELVPGEGGPVELPPGSAFIVNPGTAYRKVWSTDASQLIVRIPRRSVERIASADAEGGVVLFEPRIVSATAEVLPLLEYLWSEVGVDRGGPRSRLIEHSAARHLLTVLLYSIPNTATHPSDDAPLCLLRADHYMRGHLADDLGVDEIAQICGVSVRTLQYAFQRHWRTTPTEHLRSLRLETARRLLTEPPLKISVTEVAHIIGLPHLGRFSHYYQARFSELPSESLRRAREERDRMPPRT